MLCHRTRDRGAASIPFPPQIEALKTAGCTEVVLAINYQPEVNKFKKMLPIMPCTHTWLWTSTRPCPSFFQIMYNFINEWQEKLGVKIVCSQV